MCPPIGICTCEYYYCIFVAPIFIAEQISCHNQSKKQLKADVCLSMTENSKKNVKNLHVFQMKDVI